MRFRPGDLRRLSWDSSEFRQRVRRSIRRRNPLTGARPVIVFGEKAHIDRAEHAARYADVYERLDRKIHEPELWGEAPSDVRWRRTGGRWQRWSQLDRGWVDDDTAPAGLVEHVRGSGFGDGTWHLVDGTWIEPDADGPGTGPPPAGPAARRGPGPPEAPATAVPALDADGEPSSPPATGPDDGQASPPGPVSRPIDPRRPVTVDEQIDAWRSRG